MHNVVHNDRQLGTRPGAARVASQRRAVHSAVRRHTAWKNAEGGWESRTDWHRVVCFQRAREALFAWTTSGGERHRTLDPS